MNEICQQQEEKVSLKEWSKSIFYFTKSKLPRENMFEIFLLFLKHLLKDDEM